MKRYKYLNVRKNGIVGASNVNELSHIVYSKTLRDSWFLQSNVKNVFRVKRWTDETLDRLNFVKNSDNPITKFKRSDISFNFKRIIVEIFLSISDVIFVQNLARSTHLQQRVVYEIHSCLSRSSYPNETRTILIFQDR